MQVDVMNLMGAIEASATGGDDAAATAPDVFAGLLAALNPLGSPPSTVGSVGGESSGEHTPEPTNSGAQPDAQVPGANPPAPSAAGTGYAEVPGAVTVAGIGSTVGLLEVPRAARGLPLIPPTALDTGPAPDAKAPLAPIDEKPPMSPWGGRLATIVPAGPRPVIEPVVDLDAAGPRSGAKPAPGTESAANLTRPEGRPVPATPSLAATLSGRVSPTPTPAPEPDAVATPAAAAAAAAAVVETEVVDRLQPPPRPELAAVSATNPAPDSSGATSIADTALAAGTVPMPAVVSPELTSPSAADALSVGSDARPPVDPERVQAQVVKQMLGRLEGAGSGEQKLTLQLDPEHLGKVEVRLVATGNRLEVIFTAETAEAQQALREGSQELARNLGLQTGRWQHIEVRITEPEGAALTSDDPDDPDDQDDPDNQDDQNNQNNQNGRQEERPEHGSRHEREDPQRRRHGDEG